METEIKITEKPIFTVKTVKKKHLEQIRETTHTELDWASHDVLGQIVAWSAILLRHTTTGHYRVVPMYLYAEWLAQRDGIKPDAAYRLAYELEQLFLD